MDALYDAKVVLMEGHEILNDSANKEMKVLVDKVSQINNLSDYDNASLAIYLNNHKRTLNDHFRRQGQGIITMNDSTTLSQNVGPYVKHVMNIIAATYSTLDLKDLVSIQPLTQRRGQLFFKEYQFANNKGEVVAGNKMFSAETKPNKDPYYSTQYVNNEAVSFAADSGDGYALKGSVAQLPVYPFVATDSHKVGITLRGNVTGGGTVNLRGSGIVTDNIEVLVDAGATPGNSAGTLNLLTGAIKITKLNTVTIDTDHQKAVTDVKATYTYNSESLYANNESAIPKLTLSVNSKDITAYPRQLLFEATLLSSYDYENQFGQELNSSVEADVVKYMQYSLAAMALRSVRDRAATNSHTLSFSMATGVSQEISITQSFEAVLLFLAAMNETLKKQYGRGQGNRIVAGSNFEAILRVLPSTVFQAEKDIEFDGGAYYFGLLAQQYRVYINPDYADDDIVLMYRGKNWYDASYFIGMYLPLMAGQFMMFPDFKGQQGYYSVEGHDNIFPKLAVAGKFILTA